MLRTCIVLAAVCVAAQARLSGRGGGFSDLRMTSLADLKNALRQEEGCGGRGDIVLVVDGSGSIGPKNFDKVKAFLIDLVDSFTIGPDDVQIGVVEFSNVPYLKFNLNEYETKDEVNNGINQLQRIGSTTDTNAALKMMMSQSFTADGGDRSDAPNIGIVITDGQSDTDITESAHAAKAMGITMFAVGIGNIVKEELNTIANEPSDEYVFTVDNFDGLEEITEALAEKTCQATNPCKGAAAYEDVPGMADWCLTNCLACYCPATHCVCEGLEADCPDKRSRKMNRFLSLL